MAPRRKGLGKGLDSMFPSYTDNPRQKEEEKRKSLETGDKIEENVAEQQQTDGVVMLKLSEIEPNQSQPRKTFNEDSLIELADSIRQFGVIQPLIVQKKDDFYEIIAGERRWRAAKIANQKEIPAIIRDYSTQETMEISLIENIQREDLNAIEEAQAYERLLNEYHLKQDELAEKVSKSRTTITNSLRLLKLDERVKKMLSEDMISTGHARALLSLPDGELQYETAQRIFEEKLSVREVEKLVKKIVKPSQPNLPDNENEQAITLIYQDMEDKIKDILGTKVVVHRKSKNKGKIEIDYYSIEELERIYDLLKSVSRKKEE